MTDVKEVPVVTAKEAKTFVRGYDASGVNSMSMAACLMTEQIALMLGQGAVG
ncbi:hypothetical protein [Variovorax sp. KK3]|uniref:hypothetical protein n=1 Tax=Variovorax sp. KK3 TaxID=1855728 RepID=UPI0015C3EA7D|nr:hypothetical protein [Variovorax sp. KK3]